VSTLLAASTDSSGLLSHVLVLHGLPAYLLVGTLAFAEAALFVGFVLPGETAVILGGVLASQHAASLTLMIVVVVAVIVGDSVVYEVGQRFGPRTLQLRLIKRREKQLTRAQTYLRERGGRAVFFGRSSRSDPGLLRPEQVLRLGHEAHGR